MDIVNVKEKRIHGISIRTTNAREMAPKTARIGALVQKFDECVTVDYAAGARVYNVYSDYESDASGEYAILAGTDNPASSTVELEHVVIPDGKYIVFRGRGEVPHIVIETWGHIWAYFSQDNPQYKRTFSTDFEFYKTQNDIEIYISIE